MSAIYYFPILVKCEIFREKSIHQLPIINAPRNFFGVKMWNDKYSKIQRGYLAYDIYDMMPTSISSILVRLVSIIYTFVESPNLQLLT